MSTLFWQETGHGPAHMGYGRSWAVADHDSSQCSNRADHPHYTRSSVRVTILTATTEVDHLRPPIPLVGVADIFYLSRNQTVTNTPGLQKLERSNIGVRMHFEWRHTIHLVEASHLHMRNGACRVVGFKCRIERPTEKTF